MLGNILYFAGNRFNENIKILYDQINWLRWNTTILVSFYFFIEITLI